MRDIWGGNIYLHSPAMETEQASFFWKLAGKAAVQVARRLYIIAD